MSFQTRLLADHLDLTALGKTRPERYPSVLTSTSSSDTRLRDRYDIIFAYPQESLILNKDQSLVSELVVALLPTRIDNVNWMKRGLKRKA